MTSETRARLNRWLIGLLSIVCLAAGVAVGVFVSPDNIWCGSFVRVGLVLGAFWVAMPTKGRAAAWADFSPIWIFVAAGVMLVVIRRPWIVIPFLIALFALTMVAPLFTQKRSR